MLKIGKFKLYLVIFLLLNAFSNAYSDVPDQCGADLIETSRVGYSNYCYTTGNYLWKPVWDNNSDKVPTVFNDLPAAISNPLAAIVHPPVPVEIPVAAADYRLPTIKELSYFIGYSDTSVLGRWFEDALGGAGTANYILSSSYGLGGTLLAFQISTHDIVSLELPLVVDAYVLAVSEYSRVINRGSGRCLTRVGATAITLECNPLNIMQYWKHYPGSGDIYSIANGGLVYCLDGGNNDETKANIYDCASAFGNSNFKWNVNGGYISRRVHADSPYLIDISSNAITSELLTPENLSQLWSFDNR